MADLNSLIVSSHLPLVSGYSINNVGQVAGAADNGTGSSRPFLYTPGVGLQDLNFLSTGYGYVTGVNDRGVVTGVSITASRISSSYAGAFVYDAVAVSELGTLGGDTSTGIALNGIGQVAGHSNTNHYSSSEDGFFYNGQSVYNSQSMVDLGTPPGGGSQTTPQAINDAAQIAGSLVVAVNGMTQFHAFSWSGGVMTDLDALSLVNSNAYGINSSGQIVGSDDTGACLWQNGVKSSLNTLIDPASGWVLTTARAISNTGYVTGSGTHNGLPRAFLLRIPVPLVPAALFFAPNPVHNGQTTQGTVTLTGPAPAGGAAIAVSVGGAAAATVTVPEGQTTAPFSVPTAITQANQTEPVTAFYNGGTVATTVSINVIPVSLSFSPGTMLSGQSMTGTLTLSGLAPYGAVLALTINGISAGTVSLSSSTTTFPLTVPASYAGQTVTIAGTYNGVTVSAPVTVTAPPPVYPNSLTFYYSPALPGQTNNAYVGLTGPAPYGGAVITFTLNGASYATATVAAGQYSVTLPFILPNSYGGQTVTMTATYNGTTVSKDLPVNPPAPVLSSLSRTSAAAGDPAFTLTVTGANFLATSSVVWNSTNLATTYVSTSQLTALVPSTFLASGGLNSVRVTDAIPNGGSSSSLTFTVSNPAPTLVSLSPATTTVGGSAVTLTLTGTGFASSSYQGGYPYQSGSRVTWNGQYLSTTYISPTQMTATVPASLLTSAGTAQVTVTNSTPGGGTSAALTFTIADNRPALSAVNPASVTASGPDFTLTVTGTNFTPMCMVNWNTAALATTYVSPTVLIATVPAAYTAGAGYISVSVKDTATGASSLTSLRFTINSPVPTLSAISPPTATAGSAALTLVVTGTGFTASNSNFNGGSLYGSVVLWNSQYLLTTFVSSTQLTATVPASLLGTVGTAQVVVSNALPVTGGGLSNALPFTILPVPDTTAPTTAASLLGVNISIWYTSAVQVTLSATDNAGGSGVANTFYTLDGGAQQTYSAPFMVNGDGAHTVTFWSVDKTGNSEATKSQAVLIDTTPPTLVLGTPAPAPNAAGWNNTPVNVPFVAGDTTSGVAYASPGSPVPFGADGKNQTENVTVLDNAFNSVTQTTPALNIDQTAPITAAAVSGMTVSLSATDALSGIAATYYTVDSGVQQPYAAPFVVLGGGTHTVTFWSVDVAGNAESAKTQSVSVETTPPTTTSARSGTQGTNSWYTSAVQVTLSATDNTGGSGVASTFYTLDGGAPQPYSAPFTVSADGVHTLACWSVDNAGNIEAVKTQLLKIDTVPPMLTFGAPTPAANTAGWNNTPVDVPFTASDATSGVRSASPGSPVHLTAEGTGQAQTVTVTDDAGNSTAFRTPAVNIDRTAPITLTSVSGAFVGLSGVDNAGGSGVAATYYSVDGGPQQTYTDLFVVPGLGSHTVSYFSTDRAGNTEAARTLNVTVAVYVQSLSLSPTSVKGGAATSTGTITLTGPAPAGGARVGQTSSDTSAATLAPVLNILAGATSAKFKITTSVVSANKTVTITSALNGRSQTATLTVTGTAPVTVSGLSLSPTSVTDGSASTGTVTLSAPAPTGGAAVALLSSDTSSATVPASVLVAAGQTTAMFPVTSSVVTSTKSVTVTASLGTSSQPATLTVTPAPPAITVVSLSLSPTSVKGGTATSTGTVTLSGPAPAEGVSITQTSSDASAATLAPKLTIPAGATSAKFKITTYAVAMTKTITITSALYGISKTASLTVAH